MPLKPCIAATANLADEDVAAVLDNLESYSGIAQDEATLAAIDDAIASVEQERADTLEAIYQVSPDLAPDPVPPVPVPDDPAFSVEVIKDHKGRKRVKVNIDRAKIDRDAAHFGFPADINTLPDGDPRLQDTQEKYTIPGSQHPELAPGVRDYQPARKAEHEKWIQSYLEKGSTAEEVEEEEGGGPARPIAVLTGGGGASGKGTVLKQLQNEGYIPVDGFVHVDPDEIKTKNIPEYAELLREVDSRAAPTVHEESSDVAKIITNRAIAQRKNLIIDKTLNNREKTLKQIQDLHDAGYEVRLVGVTIDLDEALIRALSRFYGSGRLPLVSHMVNAHVAFNNYFLEYAQAVDDAVIYDNSSTPQEVMRASGGRVSISDEILYNTTRKRGTINVKSETLREVETPTEEVESGGDGSRDRGPVLGRAGNSAEVNEDAPVDLGPAPEPGNFLQRSERLSARPAGRIEPGTLKKITTTLHREYPQTRKVDFHIFETQEQAFGPGSVDRDGILQGGFYAGTNQMVLIQENIGTLDAAITTIRHEMVGHYGMRELLNKDGAYDRLLERVYRARNGELRDEYQWVARNYPELVAADDVRTMADEMLARASETSKESTLLTRIYDQIIKLLNQIGLARGKVSRREMNALVRLSEQNLRRKIRPTQSMQSMAEMEYEMYLETEGGSNPMSFKEWSDQLPMVAKRLYHGSPHRFTRFDHSKMGTGEGAQAYGWGTYLAETPDVAGQYRQAGKMFTSADGSLPTVPTFKGMRSNELKYSEAIGLDYFDNIRSFADDDPAKAAAMLRESMGNSDDALRAADWLEKNAGDISIEEASNLYTVDIPDEKIAQMLDWDAPLKRQPKTVRDGVKKILSALDENDIGYGLTHYLGGRQEDVTDEMMTSFDDWSGQQVQRVLEYSLDERGASMALLNQGIPGIKYYDGESRMAVDNEVAYPKRLESMTDDELRAEAYDVLGIDPDDISTDDIDDWVIPDLVAEDKQTTMSRVPYKEGQRTRNFVVFDENDIRITSINGERMLARRQANDAPVGTALGMPDETLREKFVRLAQNSFNRIQKLQDTIVDQGGRVSGEANVYRAEELSSGKISSRLRSLDQEHMRPLLDFMKTEGVELAELDNFLIAKHAQERNAWIASINDSMPDGGSGMTNQEAQDILDAAGDRRDILEQAAAKVYAVNEQQLDDLVEGGHLPQETVDEWRARWEYYVPLKGKAGEEGRPGTGSGFNILGAGIQKAKGRGAGNVAESPTAHSFGQAESVIVRTEKTKVGQALLQLVRDNPDPEFWTISQRQYQHFVDAFGEPFEGYTEEPAGLIENLDYTRVVNSKGKVVYKLNPNYKRRDDVFGVMQDGEEFLIQVKDPIVMEQLKKMNTTQLNAVVRGFGTVNRYLAMINTALNPEFVITNFERDFQTAMVNLGGEHSTAIAARVAKGIPGAVRGIWQSTFETSGQSEWRELYKEMMDEGGTIGFFGMEDIDTKVKHIQNRLIDQHGIMGRTKRSITAVRDIVLDANLSVENAARLSAYKVIRDESISNGLSVKEAKARAASVAKNLTVNFNRKGELAPVLNSAYLFYNASIQGSARVLTALKNPRVRKIVAGVAATAYALALYNRAAGGDDDDDIPHWDKISDYTKQTNLIIMHPDGSGNYSKIKLPYGYNVFFYAGTALHDVTFDPHKSVAGASMNMLSAFMNAFNPIQGADLLDTITPTFLKPMEQDSRNINFMGTPVKPDYPFDQYDRPESQKAWKGTNPQLKELMATINELTGGDMTHSGLIDISPEIVKHYTNWLTGGAGMTVARTVGTAGDLAAGEELEMRNIPFVRTLGGSPGPGYDTERFYNAVKGVAAVEAQLDLLKGTDEWSEYRSENRKIHELDLHLKKYKRRIKVLRDQRDQAYAAENPDKANELREEIRQQMMQFSKMYDEALEAQQ